MTSESGDRFLRFLRSSGCPNTGQLRGDDLDWMWDIAPEFLQWICRNEDVSKEMVLSEEEVQQWEALQESGEEILEGEMLERALSAVGQDVSSTRDLKNLTEQELLELNEDMTDRLNLETASADEMSHVSNSLASRMARNAIRLSKLQDHLEMDTNSQVKSKQHGIVEVNEKFNSSLDQLGQSVLDNLTLLSKDDEKKYV